MKTLKTTVLLAVATALLAALPYSNSIGNGFALDDGALVVENASVHGLSLGNLAAVFASIPTGLEYLPVRDLTYMVDYHIWGLDPAGYHLSNLVYYIALCILIFFYLRQALSSWTVRPLAPAFLSAAIFAVHPTHVEVVAAISQRKDLVAGIFLLTGLLFYGRFLEKGGKPRYAAALASFLLSLLSKPSGVAMPLVLVALIFLGGGRGKAAGTRRYLSTAPFFFLALVMALVQIAVLRQSGVYKPFYYGTPGDYPIRIYTSFKAVAFYLKLFALPYPLNIRHDFHFSTGVADPAVLSSAFLLLFLVYLAYRCRSASPPIAFSIAWFLSNVLPVIGLFPAAQVVAERYLFIPSVGLSLIVGWLLAELWKRGGAARLGSLAACALLIPSLMYATYARNPDWRNSLSLYLSGVKENPRSARLNWLVGREYFIAGQYEDAFRYFERARELNPSFGIDYAVFSASLKLKLGDADGALAALRGAGRPGVEVLDVHYLACAAYARRADYPSARRHCAAALASKADLGIYSKRDTMELLNSLDDNVAAGPR